MAKCLNLSCYNVLKRDVALLDNRTMILFKFFENSMTFLYIKGLCLFKQLPRILFIKKQLFFYNREIICLA